jgi:virulence plasmid B protein/Calx-beta domain-containing protein
MTPMRSRVFFSIRFAALLVLMCHASGAWALWVSPSPSYDGSYTVTWGTTLGYWEEDIYPCYPQHWVYLYENGQVVAGSGYSAQVSGKAPGSYEYYVYQVTYVCGAPYDEGIVEGPVTVDVIAPPPAFTISDASPFHVNETGIFAFTVTPTGYQSGSYSVNFSTLDSSAYAGVHYTANSGTLTFNSSAPQTVYVTTLRDNVVDYSKQVFVTLSAPTNGATISDGYGYGMIDNTDTVTFRITANQSVTEGGVANFTITKTGATVMNHGVYVSTADGTATTGNNDYTPRVQNYLDFAYNVGSQQFGVQTTADSTVENDETFTLTLSSPSQFSVIDSAQQTRTGTILNDDTSFSINDVTITEGGALSFTVTKSGSIAANVSYASANVSATAGNDYTTVSGTLSFTSTQVSQNVTVPTFADVWYEGNETLNVNLSAPTNGATISDAQGVGTIDDDDDNAVTGSALTALAPNTTGYAPGASAGALSVDATGNATYSFPIIVPPGTAGMQPALALTYNSGGGNGHVGIGWGLSGLSAITRCAPTLAQDGVVDGVDNDASDRFCLDGQRLILVSGTYGANGAEYRTEINQFAQIHSYGAVSAPGSGPQYFRVRTKSGRILYYGNTPDSAVEVGPGNNAIRAWAVNKIEDIVGNYMTVTYVDQAAQTDVEPTEVTYTMHNTAPGAAAFARVRFEYEAREANGYVYQGGWAITSTARRLKYIKTEAIARDPVSGASLGWTLVRNYQLAYDSGLNGVSRLTSVTECPGTGQCLPPTTFGWWNSSSAPTLAAMTVSWPSQAVDFWGSPVFGDLTATVAPTF